MSSKYAALHNRIVSRVGKDGGQEMNSCFEMIALPRCKPPLAEDAMASLRAL